MISKTVDSTNRPLGKVKNVRIDDVNVRFAWQLIYVRVLFNQILLKKRLKMTKSSIACQSFRINVKALKPLG